MLRYISPTLIFFASHSGTQTCAFHLVRNQQHHNCRQQQRQRLGWVPLYSSVGDGPPKPPSGEDSWGDFLDPKEESENLRKARNYMSEESLPISFEENDDEAAAAAEDNDEDDDEEMLSDDLSSALVGPESSASALAANFEAPSADTLANNPYLAVVTKLTPSELISKFTATANPRVQDAVRTTILGLIGGLPKLAFETTTITTGQRLASLMFQLQMTGYMFKNAEYRLSLQQSLGLPSMDLDAVSERSHFLLPGTGDDDDEDDDEGGAGSDPLAGKIRGKLKLRYKAKFEDDATETKDEDEDEDTTADEDNDNADEEEAEGVEVDAEAYLSELQSEVSRLRDELTQTRQAKEEAIRKDLLLYIRTLPEQKLKSLTNDMSQDVLVAMKGLVNAVLSGIGDGQLGPNTVTEQSGEALAQLCMWQLVVGYNLRELEVREEMKNSLFNGFNGSSKDNSGDNATGGVDFSEPGTLE